MDIDAIYETSRADFEARTRARDEALAQARTLVRFASRSIRAAHRNEQDEALANLRETAALADQLNAITADFPDIYFAGYTQDALKEHVEASAVYAIVYRTEFPTAASLHVPTSTYLNGLAEAATELRRRCLDLMRDGAPGEAEPLLEIMEDIYGLLVTMDFPDAITGGLRRQTDIVRGVLERTRGDLTISLRQRHLENTLTQLMTRLDRAES